MVTVSYVTNKKDYLHYENKDVQKRIICKSDNSEFSISNIGQDTFGMFYDNNKIMEINNN